MENIEIMFQLFMLAIAIVSVIKIIWELYYSKPRIDGKILHVQHGITYHEYIPDVELMFIVVYVYLLNTGKKTTHIIDYSLELLLDDEISYKDDKMEIERFYCLHWLNKDLLEKFKIPNVSKGVLHSLSNPFSNGKPVKGAIVFRMPSRFDPVAFKDRIIQYKLTCKDIYEREYVIESEKNENGWDFIRYEIFQEITDYDRPKKGDLPIPLSHLLTDKFISSQTSFNTGEEWNEAIRYIGSKEEIDKIVNDNSDFSTYDGLVGESIRRWKEKRMNFMKRRNEERSRRIEYIIDDSVSLYDFND